MPWKTTWYDAEETIVLYQPEDPWTWEEFMEGVQKGQAMIRAKPYMVDTIYNLGSNIHMPDSSALSRFRQPYEADPPNSGVNIIVGAPGLVRMLVGILTSTMGGKERFIFPSSMEEALQIIDQARVQRAAEGS